MAIYRGAGGAGDATNDATSQAVLAAASAVAAANSEAEAAASAVSAASSATNAASSASSASTSASNAATSASNAATSATSAATSATTATTKASEASTSATNAANSATAASTSANNASNSATSAANSATTATTQATNASNSATAAATSATNATNSATAAATSATNAANSASAASTSATNAANSATSASTSASTATTQATNAASSATAAAASASAAATSETNAATSASNAATSESNAATSASNAATSETNAASSASGAATSASSAAASAAAAAASLDSFDDRYLGSKTADPTLDNDGNALVTGALYYNSVEGEMRVYDGFQWIAASAASQAILVVYKYTATSGQTTFTGADDNALTLAYTVGSAIVTVNGVVQEVGTDVTATTGTSVVLAVGAITGDEVNIYAFSTFDVANTYTKAEADAKYLTKVNPSYTGALTGGTGVINIGSGQLYKDTAGNLGLGVTPSAWTSPFRVAQVGNGAAVVGRTDNLEANLSTNWYYNSGDKYASSDYATKYTQVTGQHKWYTAPSGTAGNAISFSQAMTLDASGNLGIGTSSPSAKLHVAGGDLRLNDYYAINWGGTGVAILGNTANNFMQFQTAGSERMRIDSGGNLLVGTTSQLTSPIGKVVIDAVSGQYGVVTRQNTTSNAAHSVFVNPNGIVGYISTGGTSTAYVTSSDYRLKENIQPMQNALDVVAQLNPVTYTWKADGSDGQGFIAHELQAVVPDCVTGEKDAVDEEGKPVYQGIDTSFLVATLTKAIQEQQEQINQLVAKVAALEAK